MRFLAFEMESARLLKARLDYNFYVCLIFLKLAAHTNNLRKKEIFPWPFAKRNKSVKFQAQII